MAVDQDTACPANTLVATSLGSGQQQVLPQYLEQRTLRLDPQRADFTIDTQVDVYGFSHGSGGWLLLGHYGDSAFQQARDQHPPILGRSAYVTDRIRLGGE